MVNERLARILLLSLLFAAVAIPVGGRWLTPRVTEAVEIRARMAEDGGWAPDILAARVGEPLELRLTSDDVIHGFAVGRHDSPEVEVVPGKWSATSLLFDKPGTYVYYCTRWCGAGHWRMRGTIEVSAEAAAEGGPAQVSASPPRYVAYGIDIDAPSRAEVVPPARPVASRGAELAHRLPDYALAAETYWRYSPAEVWQRLQDEPGLDDLPDMALWDLVAWIWAQQVTPEALAHAAEIYAQEGAAAHGETGAGDGVMVEDLPSYSYDYRHNGHEAMQPPDFTDPYHAFGASPARLEGKRVRGGMGTGMPSYGEIYTPAEIEALVAYFYTFAMDLGGASASTAEPD